MELKFVLHYMFDSICLQMDILINNLDSKHCRVKGSTKCLCQY